MSSDIITRRFDEVFDLALGRTPSRGDKSYWGGNNTWVSIADMSCGKYISATKEGITDKAVKESGIPLVKKGTVIMSFKLSIGKVCIADTDLYTNEAIMAFSPKSGYNVLPGYLYYYLQFHDWDNSNEVVLGFTLNKKTISQSLFSFPSSIVEQQHIVDILDSGFAKIAALKGNAENGLTNAKNMFQASLKRELTPKQGWKSYTLQDACIESGQYGLSVPSTVFNGIRYLRITDITEDGGLNTDCVSADIEFVDRKFLLQDGDVLFARTGATVGKTLVYKSAMGACSYAGYLIRYRPNTQIILPQILYYITHSADYYDWVWKSQKKSTLPNINAKMYNNYVISVPGISEQKKILALLDVLNLKFKELLSKYKLSISLCEDLKKALLRKVFSSNK